MRGIAGIIHFDGSSVPSGLINLVIDRMAVCKTDRTGAWSAGPVGFGHLIQFTAPEDRFEAQPIRSSDGSMVLVTDALLENRDELARDLGLPATEHIAMPDSAMILRAHQKWGADCVLHLEGKFALAIWNARQRKLFCAVDHFAFRPLYYFKRNGYFAFATTLRGLFTIPGIPRRIDELALSDFMLTQPADPGSTLYADVRVLEGGRCLEADAAGVRIRPYWEPDPHREIKLASDNEYLEAFRSEFERSIAGGLRSDKNVGIMVSGGLDSAAATVVAGKQLADRGKRLQAIHTLRGNTDPRRARLREHDESIYVRMIEKISPHIDFHYIPPHEVGPISLSRWDETFVQSWVPFRGVVTEAARDAPEPLKDLGLRRMLFGLGGNYVVSLECGQSGYFAQQAVRLHWIRLLREAALHRRVYRGSFKQTLRSQVLEPFLTPFRRPPEPRMDFIPCLNPDFVRRAGFAKRINRREHLLWDPKDFNVRRQRSWIMTDLMPQSRGVSGSVIGPHQTCDSHLPYFDRRLNEFCLAVPLEQQIRGGMDRLLLRKATNLPEAVAYRVTRGFPSEGLWEAGKRLREVLPAALEEMEKSTLVGNYLDLAEIRRQYAVGATPTGAPWMAAKRLSDLFGVGWFLRWLDKQTV